MKLQGCQEQKNRPAPTALTKKKEEVLMKKRAFVIASVLALSIMAATQVALAQDSMVVNIPFEFVAGQATLPAGEYLGQSPKTGSAVILINRTNADAPVPLVTMPTSAGHPPA